MTRRNVLKGAKLNLCHAVLAVAVASCLAPLAAQAQSMEAKATFNIPAGELASAIDAFSRQSGLQILYKPELLAGKRVAAIKGSVSNQDALARLLKGAGVRWERVDDDTFVLRQETPPRGKTKAPSTDKAPSASANDGVQELEELVVVGSRLGTSPVESAMPIKVITREDIDRSGAGNIAQALTYLSEVSLNNTGDSEIGGAGIAGGDSNTNSSAVQMRGLPRGTTLVLINGRRAGDSAMFSSTGQFDLSTIPLSLVERIEVLPAGASAVYGGDGLAGVINVVLRRDAQGTEVRMRRSVADGYDRDSISAVWGKAWDRGNVTVAINWNRNNALLSTERSITADQDFRRFGGMDQRLAGGYPATIYSLEGCPILDSEYTHCFSGPPLSSRGPLPGLTSNVATVPLGSNGTNLTPSDFLATQGQTNNSSVNRQLISPEQNRGISVSGRLDITPKSEIFSEFAYTKRKVPARQFPLFFSGYGEYGLTHVAADHPYNPFGVQVGVDFRYNDTGLYTTFSQEYMRGLVGIRGKLDRFEWELSVTQTRDKALSKGAQEWDQEKINAALATTDPAMALNPFVSDGGAPASREFIASLLTDDLNHSTFSRGDIWTGFIRGPVLTLPAGEVQALVGLERQRNEIRLDTNTLTNTQTTHVDGVITGNAAFAELRLPILPARPGSSRERVAVTGALRRESSDRFDGSTMTKTFGMEAWATEQLLFRATYSTAVRPLLSYTAVQDVEPMEAYVRDPTVEGSPYQVVPVLRGGGLPPELKPEDSTTVTMGLLYRPSPDLSVSMTHWDSKYRDRITTISPQYLLDNEEFYPSRIFRDPTTGMLTLIDVRLVNISRYDSAGVDVSTDAYLPTKIGEFNAGISASYTYKHETQITDASPIENNVAVRRYDGWAPRWKIVPRVGWRPRNGLNFTMAGRFVSRYRDSESLSTGPNAGDYQELGKIWIVDFNADVEVNKWLKGVTWLDDTRLTFGATNVLDKKPEYCVSCGYGRGYDSSIYDIVGRTYYAELRLSF